MGQEDREGFLLLLAMDFTLSDEQKLFQETARRFARQELPGLARELEERDASVGDDWMRRCAEMGFFGINLPQAYGGQGMGHLEAVLVLEEFAKVSSAVAMPIFEANFGPMAVLVHFAPEELKRRVLPQVCAGKLMVAVSMSEPDAGTALTDLKTRAEVHGDRVVVNGTKRWCSGAGHAQGYLVYCRMSEAPPMALTRPLSIPTLRTLSSPVSGSITRPFTMTRPKEGAGAGVQEPPAIASAPRIATTARGMMSLISPCAKIEQPCAPRTTGLQAYGSARPKAKVSALRASVRM